MTGPVPWWAKQIVVSGTCMGLWVVPWTWGMIVDSAVLIALSLVPLVPAFAIPAIDTYTTRKKTDALIAWAHSFAIVAMTGGSDRLPRDCFSVFDFDETSYLYDRWWSSDIRRHVSDEETWRLVHAWPHMHVESSVYVGRVQPPRGTMAS